MFAISNFFTSIGFNMPFMFLPDRAILSGILFVRLFICLCIYMYLLVYLFLCLNLFIFIGFNMPFT
jgi:hypothetical protein